MAPRGVPWPSRGVPWPLYEDHSLELLYYLYWRTVDGSKVGTVTVTERPALALSGSTFVLLVSSEAEI